MCLSLTTSGYELPDGGVHDGLAVKYRAAMALRWDWLQPLVTAPCVPTLGPVHPQAVTASLFADLIEVAGTGRLLPYDKDRRWADRKDEHHHAPKMTVAMPAGVALAQGPRNHTGQGRLRRGQKGLRRVQWGL